MLSHKMRGGNIKSACYILLFCQSVSILTAQPGNTALSNSEIALIRQRLRHIALGYGPGDNGTEPPSPKALKDALRLCSSQHEDGHWDGIDYASTRRSNWPATNHFDNMLSVCRTGCRLPAGDPNRSRCLAAVHRAITCWQVKQLKSDNWWHHNIFMPEQAGQLLLMLGDDATDRERAFMVDTIMPKSTISMTGQNRTWLSSNVFVHALLTKDPELAQKAIQAILDELHVTTGEGIQPDWSFHQHGAQLQWGNYGLAFANEASKWLWVIRGTALQDDRKIETLRHYLLEGQRWVVWKDCYDISGQGRQMGTSNSSKALALTKAFGYMESVDPAQADTYRQFIDQTRGRKGVLPTGNRYFWRSDQLIHRTACAMTAIKMNSAHLLGTEAGGNRENLPGSYLSDGACFLYCSGHEYDNVFPVWNWRQIPGTTLIQSEATPPVPGWNNPGNQLPFVGGVSDGRQGCCAMDYNYNRLSARKAWFTREDSLVCLGAGICSPAADPVATTINQCLLNGQVTVTSENQTDTILNTGSVCSSSVRSVSHDGYCYRFLQPANVRLDCSRQTGNWKRVHDAQSENAVTQDIFNLRIDHGRQPNNADYAYAVQPTAGGKPAVPEILCNTTTLQAVRFENAVMAIFYDAAPLSWGHTTIHPEKPCIILLDTSDSGQVQVWISEPTRKEQSIGLNITCNDHLYQQDIHLPADSQAGSTVHITLKIEDTP